MAKRNVNVVVKAYDQASKKFNTIGKSAGGMGGMLKKAALAAGAYFGARAIKNFFAGSLELYGRQQKAIQNLTDALNLLGKGSRDKVKDLEKFAAGIQKTTTYGDEAVLEIMAMGSAMGKMAGDELKKATTAAIGLSKAYKIDLIAAMRLVARARMGDTTTLARYGIKLGEGLSKQEKFNKILEIGAKNFKLAEGETKTYAGAIEQAKNAIGDLRERIGEMLAPRIIAFANWIKTINVRTVQSALNFTKWAVSIGSAIFIAPKLVAAVMGITKAIKALATGQAVVQALGGPAGWASLATGMVIATGSVYAIDKVFGNLNTTMAETQQELKGVATAVDNTASSVKKSVESFEGIRALNKYFQRLRQEAEGAERAQKAAFSKDVSNRIDKLIKQVRDFGKSEGQLLVEDMLKAGWKATGSGIEVVRGELRTLSHLEKRQKATELLKDTIADLRREIEIFGKTEIETMMYDLRKTGAYKREREEVKKLMEQLQEMRSAAIKKIQPQLAFREAGFLTFAPGKRFNYYENEMVRYAKDNNRSLKEMNRSMKIQQRLLERRDVRGAETEIAVTDFR